MYLNKSELPLVMATPEPNTRDVFELVHEKTHSKEPFATFSDLSWYVLRKILADHAAKIGM